jgi:hypothetical protein
MGMVIKSKSTSLKNRLDPEKGLTDFFGIKKCRITRLANKSVILANKIQDLICLTYQKNAQDGLGIFKRFL